MGKRFPGQSADLRGGFFFGEPNPAKGGSRRVIMTKSQRFPLNIKHQTADEFVAEFLWQKLITFIFASDSLYDEVLS